MARQRTLENVGDQGGLARTGDAGDRDEQAQRELGRDIAQVVFTRAVHREQACRVARTTVPRHVDATRTAQILSRNRGGGVDHIVNRASRDDFAAMLASARTEIDEVVGLANRFFVVLDDDDRVAEITELLERVEQPPVVALVQADAGFVEDIQHADEA